MFVRRGSKSYGLRFSLLLVAASVFLGGLGAKLIVYRTHQDNATVMLRVRLGPEKQPEVAAVSRLDRSAIPSIPKNFSSAHVIHDPPAKAAAQNWLEQRDQTLPTHPSYNSRLSNLAHRPPPFLS